MARPVNTNMNIDRVREALVDPGAYRYAFRGCEAATRDRAQQVADDGTPKWKISAYRQDKAGNTEIMRVSVWQQDPPQFDLNQQITFEGLVALGYKGIYFEADGVAVYKAGGHE